MVNIFENEKEYLKRLLKELRLFLISPEDKKIELVENLSKDFHVDEENNDISDRTKEISSNLSVLTHYEEDPEGYLYLVKSLLEEVEKQLELISPEEELEEKEIEEQDDLERENEDEESY
jgi:hypothetical protein